MNDRFPLAAAAALPEDLRVLDRYAATLSRLGVLQPALRVALIERALSEAAIAMPPPERLQTLEERFWRQQRLHPRQRQRWMELRGLGGEDIRRIASRPWRWGQWCEQRWAPRQEALFLRYKNQLDRATALILEVEQQGLANELYLQLSEGESSFSELARRHCHNRPGRKGGRIGPTALSELPAPIAELIRTSPPGVLREPVRVAPQRWAILRVEQYAPASLNDPTLPPRLFRLHGESRLQRWIDDWLNQRQLAAMAAPNRAAPEQDASG